VSALKYMNGRFLLQAFVAAYLMRRASGPSSRCKLRRVVSPIRLKSYFGDT